MFRGDPACSQLHHSDSQTSGIFSQVKISPCGSSFHILSIFLPTNDATCLICQDSIKTLSIFLIVEFLGRFWQIPVLVSSELWCRVRAKIQEPSGMSPRGGGSPLARGSHDEDGDQDCPGLAEEQPTLRRLWWQTCSASAAWDCSRHLVLWLPPGRGAHRQKTVPGTRLGNRNWFEENLFYILRWETS